MRCVCVFVCAWAMSAGKSPAEEGRGKRKRATVQAGHNRRLGGASRGQHCRCMSLSLLLPSFIPPLLPPSLCPPPLPSPLPLPRPPPPPPLLPHASPSPASSVPVEYGSRGVDEQRNEATRRGGGRRWRVAKRVMRGLRRSGGAGGRRNNLRWRSRRRSPSLFSIALDEKKKQTNRDKPVIASL